MHQIQINISSTKCSLTPWCSIQSNCFLGMFDTFTCYVFWIFNLWKVEYSQIMIWHLGKMWLCEYSLPIEKHPMNHGPWLRFKIQIARSSKCTNKRIIIFRPKISPVSPMHWLLLSSTDNWHNSSLLFGSWTQQYKYMHHSFWTKLITNETCN